MNYIRVKSLWPWDRLKSLTEMSTRILPWKVKGGRRVGLTISQPSVSRLSRKMWEPRRLTTLWTSTAYYRDSFAFTLLFMLLDLTVLGAMRSGFGRVHWLRQGLQGVHGLVRALVTVHHPLFLPQCSCNNCRATSCHTSHFSTCATRRPGLRIRPVVAWVNLSGLGVAFVAIVAELTVAIVGPLAHVVKPALHWGCEHNSGLDRLLSIRDLSHVLSDEMEKAFQAPHLVRKNVPIWEITLLQWHGGNLRVECAYAQWLPRRIARTQSTSHAVAAGRLAQIQTYLASLPRLRHEKLAVTPSFQNLPAF
jgi:hypothetical protein